MRVAYGFECMHFVEQLTLHLFIFLLHHLGLTVSSLLAAIRLSWQHNISCPLYTKSEVHKQIYREFSQTTRSPLSSHEHQLNTLFWMIQHTVLFLEEQCIFFKLMLEHMNRQNQGCVPGHFMSGRAGPDHFFGPGQFGTTKCI